MDEPKTAMQSSNRGIGIGPTPPSPMKSVMSELFQGLNRLEDNLGVGLPDGNDKQLLESGKVDQVINTLIGVTQRINRCADEAGKL